MLNFLAEKYWKNYPVKDAIQGKINEESKEIKQKRKGLKKIDTCFSVIFKCYDQSVICGRKTGHLALPPSSS